MTPEFRAAWPDHFVPMISADPAPSVQGGVKATLLANERDAVLEINGEHYRLRLKEAKLEKIEAEEAAKLIAAPPPPPPEPGVAILPLRNQPTFDHYLVNLPTTRPYDRGSISVRFTHRFTQPLFRVAGGCGGGCAGGSDLLGFDSFSYSSLGGAVGITNRLAAIVYRSPLDRNVEMGGVFHLLKQQGNVPFSASLRATMETRRLFVPADRGFRRFQTANLVFPISRSFSTIAEAFVVPMMSFKANPFASSSSSTPLTPEGETREHQGAIGLGASIRFRPRSAFVMEWMPRIAGYRAGDTRNTYSFGILRSTNRHVFELTLTNSFTTTTSQSIATGSRDFSLGFNIYRQLRW